MELSILALKHLISEQGEKRVSEDSAKELGQQIEFWSQGIAARAQQIAEQQDRKTVRAEDIRQALNELKHSQRSDYRQISKPETSEENKVLQRLKK